VEQGRKIGTFAFVTHTLFQFHLITEIHIAILKLEHIINVELILKYVVWWRKGCITVTTNKAVSDFADVSHSKSRQKEI